MQNPFKAMRWNKEEKENLLLVLGAIAAGAFFFVGATFGCYIRIWTC